MKEETRVDPLMPIWPTGNKDPKTCEHKWNDWGETHDGLRHFMCWGCHLHQDRDWNGKVIREEVHS